MGLLEMAVNDRVEAVLAVRLKALLAAGVLPDVKRLREEFAPRKAEVPHVMVEIPPPSAYDALMLTELRRPTMSRLWEEFAQRSDKEGWPAGRFLGGSLEHEFAEVPMLSKAHASALAGGGSWIDKGEAVLIFGPPGVGKSHVACGIGHALIDAGYRVLYMRTSELVQRLQAARQSLQLPQALEKLDRYDLLILDDLSHVRKDQAETSVLFRLISERDERRSILITADQPFSGWGNVFPDPGMTVAAIDRLVHHSTIFELKQVESYRSKEALRLQRIQLKNDKNFKRQSSKNSDNQPKEPMK